MDPQPAEVHYLLGTSPGLERLDLAIKCFQAALELDPQDPRLHGALGNALYELDKSDLAIVCYRQALELADDKSQHLFWLGRAKPAKAQHAEAVESFRGSLAVNPGNAFVALALGRR